MHTAGSLSAPIRQRSAMSDYLLVLVLTAFSAQPVFAQKPSGGGSPSGPSAPSVPTSPRTAPSPTIPRPPSDTGIGPTTSLFLAGRVVLDQGVAPPESVVVEQVCGNTVRARTRTDLRGGFSLPLGQASFPQSPAIGDASDSGESSQSRQRIRLIGCELRAVFAGFVSTELQLDGSDLEVGIKNVGTIILKRIGGPQSGSTVSVTSFQVPDKARKEYEKALKDLQQENRNRAREHLLKAVDLYPKYAAAWVSLGELYTQLNNITEAKAAFTRAQEADPAYVPPYLHLAYFAAKDSKWDEVLKLSEQAIRLDPANYPDSHFLNAAANFNLHHLVEARRAALKAAEMDHQRRLPRIHYLLSTIYEASGERELAAAQLREYLEMAPNSPDAASAREHLARLGKQTAKAETE